MPTHHADPPAPVAALARGVGGSGVSTGAGHGKVWIYINSPDTSSQAERRPWKGKRWSSCAWPRAASWTDRPESVRFQFEGGDLLARAQGRARVASYRLTYGHHDTYFTRRRRCSSPACLFPPSGPRRALAGPYGCVAILTSARRPLQGAGEEWAWVFGASGAPWRRSGGSPKGAGVFGQAWSVRLSPSVLGAWGVGADGAVALNSPSGTSQRGQLSFDMRAPMAPGERLYTSSLSS
eukprot:scaffold7461_cov417-Prasinococcus_capsulatus_cf.AAC.1